MQLGKHITIRNLYLSKVFLMRTIDKFVLPPPVPPLSPTVTRLTNLYDDYVSTRTK